MVLHLKLTVNDCLKRNTFQKAKVIAGKKGLNRIVKWAHVMEVTHIGKLLNGQELILTTGVAWKENKKDFYTFLQQLIDHNVSALCIELGTYLSVIPEEIKSLADTHDFPLIVFYEEVRFIDITHDLHSYMMEQHYKMVTELESYSQKLNQFLLGPNAQTNILQLLHATLGMQVIYKCNEKFRFVPELSESEKEETVRLIQDVPADCQRIIKQPIQAFDHQFAELIIVSKSADVSESDALFIDRSATALANELLRELFVEEKRRAKETGWIQDWLEGRHSDEEIKRYISEVGVKLTNSGGAVSICQLGEFSDPMQYTYFQILFRSIFEQHGFFLFTFSKRNELIFLMIDQREEKTYKKRLESGLAQVKNNKKVPLLFIGVGKRIKRLSEFHISYQTAGETIQVQKKMGKDRVGVLYEDLHMYRVIARLPASELEEMISDYLQPIIENDKKNNSNLMETLKAYLACNGSKQETATSLFIVRQTLYHRIKKLEELLGKDFMEPEKRQALEFAIMAYEYLA
ncbi:PucR family transcriptional regulator [Fictibacillus gelatini]|uniref:PucR family transcriptional regulator n=1 Tax=Fictibacillus gelatini TaxID=225985 RepID=UPI0004147CC1|nr:PucR family transcriptional regulator [Fictibacillus gelatini]